MQIDHLAAKKLQQFKVKITGLQIAIRYEVVLTKPKWFLSTPPNAEYLVAKL